jgi:CRISPR-associated protein Cas5h
MTGLTFRLSGNTAMFKKRDVNSSIYLTYNHIHKVALLGILGSIIGLDGYGQQYQYNISNDDKMKFPEFYHKLQDLKVAIVPLSSKGYFSKKLQVFNNSVGYASAEEGGNLIVREYWLEYPKWQIYLYSTNQDIMDELKDYLLGGKCVYTPYLGKNDHLADITNVKEVEFSIPDKVDKINSLVSMGKINFTTGSLRNKRKEDMFMFKESLPIGLVSYDNIYVFDTFLYTNQYVKDILEDKCIYSCEGNNLYMF